MKNQKKRNNKGFSLVELIVVIAIMAILMAVLAPVFSRYIDTARQSNDASMVSSVVTACQTAAVDPAYKIKAGTYTLTFSPSGLAITDGDTASITDLTNAIIATCGAVTDLKTTSSNWDGTSTNEIIVKFTIAADGTLSETYSAKFAAYSEKTPTPAGS